MPVKDVVVSIALSRTSLGKYGGSVNSGDPIAVGLCSGCIVASGSGEVAVGNESADADREAMQDLRFMGNYENLTSRKL